VPALQLIATDGLAKKEKKKKVNKNCFEAPIEADIL